MSLETAIQNLADAINNLANATPQTGVTQASTTAEKKETPKKETPKKETPKKEEPKEEPAKKATSTEVENAEIDITLLRDVGMKLIKAGKTSEMKDAIERLGAENITSLDEEKYAEAYQLLKAIPLK